MYKQITYPLFMLVALLAMISCGKKEVQENYVILSGVVENVDIPEDIIVSGDRYMRFTQNLKMAEDGSFSDTLYLPVYDKEYNLTFPNKARYSFWATPGNHVKITMDVNDIPGTIKYEGKNAAIDEYMLAKKSLVSNFLPEGKKLHNYPEEEFIAKSKELSDQIANLLNQQTELPKEFVEQEEKNILYDRFRPYNTYQFFRGRTLKDPSFSVSESFWDEYNTVNLSDVEEYKRSFSYQDLVIGKIRRLPKTELTAEDGSIIKEGKGKRWLRKVAENVENPEIRELMLHNSMLSSMKAISEEEEMKETYNYYLEASDNKELQDEVGMAFKEASKLWPGNPSPTFVDYRNHDGSTTSLEDLKGKYVYIDVWATWCGPCKREIPFLKEVEKEYSDSNIAFVSLSADKEKDFNKWKKMVDDMELTGIQLFADNNFLSEFLTEYKVTAIPRFILIDDKGLILQASAPRPSSNELKELLNSLNI